MILLFQGGPWLSPCSSTPSYVAVAFAVLVLAVFCCGGYLYRSMFHSQLELSPVASTTDGWSRLVSSLMIVHIVR
jgi:archaellum component FlaF (FlaF/FlaG flagellin family)